MPDKKEYDTADIYLAAYLCLIGLNVRTARVNPSKVCFYFSDYEAAEKASEDFYGKAKVSAIDLCSELRNLKSRVSNKKK
jgi:hypothetical protein